MAQNEFFACKRPLFGLSRTMLTRALVWGRQ